MRPWRNWKLRLTQQKHKVKKKRTAKSAASQKDDLEKAVRRSEKSICKDNEKVHAIAETSATKAFKWAEHKDRITDLDEELKRFVRAEALAATQQQEALCAYDHVSGCKYYLPQG